MAEQNGEKIHEPSQRRLEEAMRRGQIPTSAEVQTACVFIAFLLAVLFVGRETWVGMLTAFRGTLGHLNELELSRDNIQHNAIQASLFFARVAGVFLLTITAGALLAGGMQSRFQTFSEALRIDWDRLDPSAGFGKIFSAKALVPTLISLVKALVILLLTYGQIMQILHDPIFSTAVTPARLAEFLASTAMGITVRVTLSLGIIAAGDYAYQFWRHHQDLMMTHEEFLDEQKSTEGNPHVKAAQKRRRQRISQKKMLLEVPKADFVVTNPTHLAVALRYDRTHMKAPMVVAKGSRLNALKIREIARQHQVPIIENKPLARMLFKFAKVGGEIPAQFYAAVAELLAYVYRVNRYRYYTEQNRTAP